MDDFDPQVALGRIRGEIDSIDAAMHALLIERGLIINDLIEIKRRQGGGSAFRPIREAEMMRRIVERHSGPLPLDTVESIWRVIISTFTYVQSPYSVHADFSGADAPMRDSARFHFGFTVPLIGHLGPGGAIAAVADSRGDLGMLRIEAAAVAGPWWRALAGPDAPKVIARLPMVERSDHPASLPIFVIAQPLAEAAARDCRLYALSLERWNEALPAALGEAGARILGNAADDYGISVLIEAPGALEDAGLAHRIAQATGWPPRLDAIGSHAGRYAFVKERAPAAP